MFIYTVIKNEKKKQLELQIRSSSCFSVYSVSKEHSKSFFRSAVSLFAASLLEFDLDLLPFLLSISTSRSFPGS